MSRGIDHADAGTSGALTRDAVRSTHSTSAPAPVRQRVLAQARFETGILLRNGEQLLVSLVLPVMALLGATLTPYPPLTGDTRIDIVAPGVLAMAIISTAFTGQAIATGFDRRYGVLRMLGTTPLGRGGLLAARMIAVLVVEIIQTVVLAAVAFALGWHPAFVGVLPAAVFALLGTAAFVSLAMLMAGTLRAEATLALANLVWILLIALGGVIIPGTSWPAPWSTLVGLLPSAALAEGFRTAYEHGALAWGPLLVLAVWAVLSGAAAARWFRWSE